MNDKYYSEEIKIISDILSLKKTKSSKSGTSSKRSDQLSKKKSEIKDLKWKVEMFKDEVKVHQRDSRLACEHLERVEKENKGLKEQITILQSRIEKLNSFKREDILDLEE